MLRERLRAERRRQGLTVRDLAHRMGYHENSVANWEHGVTDPRLPALVDWAQALGLTIQLERCHESKMAGAASEARDDETGVVAPP